MKEGSHHFAVLSEPIVHDVHSTLAWAFTIPLHELKEENVAACRKDISTKNETNKVPNKKHNAKAGLTSPWSKDPPLP